MPKRKRFTRAEDSGENDEIRKNKVIQKIAQGKKQLHRVLKIAKNFERQKLGKRLTRAETTEAKARINAQIKILKCLDLSKFVNSHLNKMLLKVKSFAQSGLLPDDVRKSERGVMPGEEIAFNNVVSGILNMKTVKDTMDNFIHEMYVTMGIPAPIEKFNDESKIKLKRIKISHGSGISNDSEDKINLGSKTNEDESYIKSTEWSPEWSPVWMSSSENSTDDVNERKIYKQYSMEEDGLESYGSLLGTSDEESFDDKEYMSKLHAPSKVRSSPSVSFNDFDRESSISSVNTSSHELSKQQIIRPKKDLNIQPRPVPTKVGLSTFLPTLMGGYWSGSEESASDIENFTCIKKNRPGQMARRAIAEKKYGQMANHIRLAKEKRNRDDGWDAKRGAVEYMLPRGRDHGLDRGRGRGRGFGLGLGQRNSTILSRVNSQETKDKYSGDTKRSEVKNTVRKRDDMGVLHPSWQAAKKAKELKKTATFQGKKVKFD